MIPRPDYKLLTQNVGLDSNLQDVLQQSLQSTLLIAKNQVSFVLHSVFGY